MMRVTLALAMMGAMLAGCDQMGSTFRSAPITTTPVEGKLRGSSNRGERVRVWRDPETRCQYLVWENRRHGSMTPRLNPDGRPMCGGGAPSR